jgi:hypothetical protein
MGGISSHAKWLWASGITGFILLGASWASGAQFDHFTFHKVTGQSILNLLAPLFVIALFIERALEVFVSAWRDLGRSGLEEDVKVAEESIKAAKEKKDSAAQARAETDLQTARKEVSKYKRTTGRYSFLGGVSAGILISCIGIRVLNPLVDWDTEMVGGQQTFFNIIDIIITGGLLGGGSDGIHKIMNVILGFLEKTSELMKNKK